MVVEQRQPSQIVPVLVAALVCDVAVADPSTGKKNLIGVFDRVQVGTFPTQRQMSLYIKITDAEGFYRTEVRYVQVRTGQVLATAEGELQANDRLASSDLHIEFPPLAILSDGRYEFQVWFNSMYLGAAFIDAVPLAAPTGG